MNFKAWLKLQEVGTGTSSIAMFKSPIFGEPIRRQALGPWGEQDPFFKKKRRKFIESVGVEADILADVAERTAKSPFGPSINITDLLAKYPMPIKDMFAILTRMYDAKQIHLGPYTQAPALHPHPEHLLPLWGDKKYYVLSAQKNEHGGDPTAYGSTLGSDPDGQSLPSSPLKAVSSMGQTLPQGDQPTLLMPIKTMKRKMKKSSK